MTTLPFVGTIPAKTSGADTLFANLLEFQWRGIGFPVEKTDVVLRQDLVIHKFADRDGAHVEATGRHPLQISATIPFIIGINAGPNESWRSTPLYPNQFRAFFTACTDNTSGTLQHPEFGPLTCKLEQAKFSWSATRRGGVDVEATWVESDDTTGDLTAALATSSPVAGLSASAADLDTQLAAVNPAIFPKPYVPPVSFSSMVAQVTGVIDSVTVLQHQYAGQLGAVIYACQQVQTSLNMASNAVAWPIQLSTTKTLENARNALSALLSQGKQVSTYIVNKDSTMGQLATAIPANIGDIITLNPTLCQSPIVPIGTSVRYYPVAA